MKIQLSEHFTYKKLFRFVLPSIFMMMFTSVYGVVDGLFVSNFIGKTPFAAINLVMPFIMILGGMGFMLGTGGTALVARILGTGDKDRACRTFTLVIAFAVILGGVLTVLGMTLVRPVARLFGATDDMIGYCVTYGRIIMCFTVFFMIQNIFQSFLAAAEKPKMGLAVTLIAGCTNVVLDALFVAVFKWGIVGAAVATGIGQFVGGIIPLVYFSRKNSSLLRFTKPKFEPKTLLKVCTNGSSELLTNVASSVVSICYNFQLMKYLGENGVSAYGVLMYVQFIFVALEFGFTVGSAPIVSFNYGAANHDELKNVFRKSMIIMSFTGVLLCGIAQAVAIPLAKAFVGYDRELYELTVHAFRLFSFAFIFSGITIYTPGFFTALNNGLISAILSFLRSLVFQIAFVLLLPLIFGVGGIWWAMFATECGAIVLCTSLLIAMRKKYHYA